nr:protein MAIN-LIKE 1-like [Ipomoea trifida]
MKGAASAASRAVGGVASSGTAGGAASLGRREVACGLPINGKAVTGASRSPKIEMKESFDITNKKNRVYISWLINKYSKQQFGRNDDQFAMQVKAFMLFMIGAYILSDNSGDTVDPQYMSILSDIDSIRTYAWGAASLVNLHLALERFKKGSIKKCMSGLVFPLMISASLTVEMLHSELKWPAVRRIAILSWKRKKLIWLPFSCMCIFAWNIRFLFGKLNLVVDNVCVLICRISTGFGVTVNVVKPTKGSTVAIFGLDYWC